MLGVTALAATYGRVLRRRLPAWIDSGRATARTAVFLVKVLPMLPSRPMDWLTGRPLIERVTYPTRTGTADGDLYRPAGTKPRPGIVVCLGVVPFGVDHPQVARLGEALARSGFAALLSWSPAMRDERLDPDDAENLALAYDWLVRQPGIDAARSGLLGTCVGGAFALMAGSTPLIRERVAFLAAFAPYASMRTFVRDVASASRVRNGAREPWAVDPLTRTVFTRTLTAELEPTERDTLRDAPSGGAAAPPDPATLSEAGRAALDLLRASDLETATSAIEALPAPMRARLDALSPATTIALARAPLIVIAHDLDDHVIPVSESRQLMEALAGHPGAHYTEFRFFHHATPRRLALLPLARELARFFAYVQPIFRQAATR